MQVVLRRMSQIQTSLFVVLNTFMNEKDHQRDSSLEFGYYLLIREEKIFGMSLSFQEFSLIITALNRL